MQPACMHGYLIINKDRHATYIVYHITTACTTACMLCIYYSKLLSLASQERVYLHIDPCMHGENLAIDK